MEKTLQRVLLLLLLELLELPLWRNRRRHLSHFVKGKGEQKRQELCLASAIYCQEKAREKKLQYAHYCSSPNPTRGQTLT